MAPNLTAREALQPAASATTLATVNSDPASSQSTTDLTRSARELLIDWANQQDGWVRAIVGEVVSTRRELSPASLEAVKARYLAEKQLADEHGSEVPPLGDSRDAADAGEALRLVALSECSGVNALAEDQEIAFNPRMTVLFGENATGKTGYVRVLKRLANVRSAETIIPDIYRPSRTGAPHAVVRYAIGDDEQEITWDDEKGVPPFTRITVFDSPAVALHLEDSVTYVYTPADLALFRYVHSAIDGVRALLDAEVAARQPRQNPFLTAFVRGTPIYPKVEGLSASTNLAELDEFANVSEAARTELETLKVSVDALSSAASEGRAEMLRTRAAVLRNLITVGEAIARFEPTRFADAIAAESRAREEQGNAATAVFAGGQLPAELRPAWQAFIEAGERYLIARDESAYPSADDVCIYCGQELDVASRALLAAYREYASGAATGAVQAAGTQVAALKAPLSSVEVATAIEGVRTMLPGLEGSEQAPEWVADARGLLGGVDPLRDAALQGTAPAAGEVIALAAALLPRLRAAATEGEMTLKTLEGDAKERARVLADERARVSLLEARLTLARLLPEIRSHVEQAAWANRLRTLLGRFQGLLRGLTDTSKVASQDILNRDFERVFYEECKALRAPNVTLDFPGRRGEAARRKSVAPDHSLAEILSQGEQKVIAIADFLAEASLRPGSAPIVFDDPVDSFDHRRVREIAKRIAALSHDHQVVVFTHDIWFAAELLGEFEQRSSDCLYYQVVEDGGLKGVVSKASHPRLDTVPKIRARLNKAIQDTQGANAADRQAQVDAAYDHIRAWCEIVVETVLLARVTQRYQPNVAMQNLESIKPDLLGAAVSGIFPIWEKSNRYVLAHSQPLITLGVRPSLDELRGDWATLQQALKDYEAG